MSKPSPRQPQLSNEPTLGSLIRALASSFWNALRDNKLAAVLAVFSCGFVTFLAFSIQYDERPRYRQEILPELQAAESNFINAMENAEHAPNDVWRLHYFLTAHLKVRDVLKVARNRFPATAEGLAAHQEFIRYYELVDEELSIIRTQMSVDEAMDYWAEWKKQRALLSPVRERWEAWLMGRS